MTDTDQTPASVEPATTRQTLSAAPYSEVLAKAFDKLTSQILIFLLAYVILLIGLATLGSQLAPTIRNLLYMIPLLGVAAFVFERRQKIVRDGRQKGIDINARNVSGSASVIGVRGATNDLPENVTLRVGRARDKAVVHGVEYAGVSDLDAEPADSGEQYLLNLFKRLNEDNRSELIATAQRMKKKQG